MDLVSGIVNFKQAELASKVQYAVAAKILQSQRDNGSAALELLNAASKGINTASDQLAAAATGLGSLIDVQG